LLLYFEKNFQPGLSRKGERKMSTKRIPLIILILFSLSCNAVTQVFVPATSTPTASPTPNATSLEAGLYIPPSCQGQAVATLPAATTMAEATPSLGTDSTISKQTQLRVFDKLSSTITKVYLYPDFNGLDWPAIVAKYRAKVKAGLDTQTFYAEMEKFVTELGDEHSFFLSPAGVAASNLELLGHTEYVGIGILILPMPEKNRLSILSILPGSSAEYGGLKQHDSILAVDGIPIVQNGEVHSEWVRGPECSAEVLTVQSPGQEPRQVMFMRYRITSPLPIVAQLVPTTDGSRIGYIFLPSFFDETIPGQVKKALEDFGPLDGLILDNRMNGGGSSSVLEPILSYFTAGTLGNFVSRTETHPLKITANPIENSQTVPLVVLVGKDTVSFGEISSGALQDIGRAKVVGETTLGNVETLSGYDFEDGSQAWIAHERFDPLNSHADWEKDGIIPDVQAHADWDTFTLENDPSVAAALELLGHK
jgi:carboxyl-terminal processing protease